VDVFTNVNDSPKISLSNNVHGLSIDLTEPNCVRNYLITTHDASSLVNL
jgi:hypothetical protein